jgi:pyruvate dehydrogenase E2 component (dihydrolipoamide acetyltransferase)
MPIEIRIPRLGWSMEEGRFLGWQKKDGDRVQIGDVLYELEGEKAIQEVESVDNGVLRIPPDCPKPDTMLPVGALLGYVTAEGEAAPWESTKVTTSAAAPSTTTSTAKSVSIPPAAGPAVRRMARQMGISIESVIGSGPAGRVMHGDLQRSTATGDRRPVVIRTSEARTVASPRARRVASELGIDWSGLAGSGRDGRIREMDVRQAASNSDRLSDPPRTTAPGHRIPLTSRRKTIARRMLASLDQSAPVTLISRVEATRILSLRTQFKAAGQGHVVPAITDIVAKLAATVLQAHPLLAGRWQDDHIVVPLDDGFHIGIAVDTSEGLVVPVLRNVLNQSLPDLARSSRDLIDRARQGKATAAELDGGVFTITNLGSFGIDDFTPIINLPETAILGLGAIRREAVVVEGDRIEPRDLMTLSLTFDHRVIDGAPAARFLNDLRQAIEGCKLDAPAS